MLNPVEFVGAGPGAEDLITLRGADLLAAADVVLYAGSLVNPALLKRCKPNCAIHDSASLNLEEQVRIMVDAARANLRVVRLHTGDPAVYGAIGEQMDALATHSIPVRVTPGVSSVFAAAAALSCELTRPNLSQTVILTRTAGRTPMPESENPTAFARTGATLAFFLSAGNLESLTDELIGELPPETPAAVVYRASWPDEKIVRGTLATIATLTREAGIQRQALVFVGKSLHAAPATEPSKLYDSEFSHGYRNTLPNEDFYGTCAMYAFTDQGLRLAKTLKDGLGLDVTIFGPEDRTICDKSIPSGGLEALVSENWKQFAAHIFVSASGIAVRAVAPLLRHKAEDPAVLCCPETGAFVLPLVSGHLGGANRLARRAARITGGQALVSTATDLHNLPAFDEVAALEGATVCNPEMLRFLNAALLDGTPIDFVGSEAVYSRYFAETPNINFVAEAGDKLTVFWNAHNDASGDTCANVCAPNRLVILSRTVVLGVGCRKGASPDDLLMAARDLLLRNGISHSQLAAVATCDVKAEEPALCRLAEMLGVPLHCLPALALEPVGVPTPSDTVRDKVGTPSVAEAAALLVATKQCGAGTLTLPKQSLGNMTFAIAQCGFRPKTVWQPASTAGSVTVVGIGSGEDQHLTPEVRNAIRTCKHIAGYSGYLDLIRPLLTGKILIETPMRGEVERCRAALDAARNGHAVCLVCSGDPGVLAMAGLIYELRRHEPEFSQVAVAVLPGITAANLAAAALGAPLQNGFSLVSLSDLLVPADEVRTNVAAAAKSALPLVLYNPAGRKRRHLMEEALDMLLAERGPTTPAAFVRHAGRSGEQRWVGELAKFPRERVDMSTLIIVGGPRTVLHGGLMFEERGYKMDKQA